MTEEQRECPKCGEPVDGDGDSFSECVWGPNKCDECGSCYCDWSC